MHKLFEIDQPSFKLPNRYKGLRDSLHDDLPDERDGQSREGENSSKDEKDPLTKLFICLRVCLLQPRARLSSATPRLRDANARSVCSSGDRAVSLVCVMPN